MSFLNINVEFGYFDEFNVKYFKNDIVFLYLLNGGVIRSKLITNYLMFQFHAVNFAASC